MKVSDLFSTLAGGKRSERMAPRQDGETVRSVEGDGCADLKASRRTDGVNFFGLPLDRPLSFLCFEEPEQRRWNTGERCAQYLAGRSDFQVLPAVSASPLVPGR